MAWMLASTTVFVAGSAAQTATAGPSSPAQSAALVSGDLPAATHDVVTSPAPLFDLNDSDIKFKLDNLTRTLRDARHEGWVLAAYPDPKTSRPLIGAGFGLDIEAMQHPQSDPLNPHQFLEPSSQQLWQAAGLDPDKLQNILERYDRDLEAWKKKNFRRKIRTHSLTPEVSEDEALKLLRISAIQAAFNARAYCRNFDQLTASQQMGLSQLVYQMGVNLGEFSQFLGVINQDNPGETVGDSAHWKTVQDTLIESQWARRYRIRAVSVIAMFDPQYDSDPGAAERKVEAVLHPPAHHHKKQHGHSGVAGHHATHTG
jgi:hypothetical protein